MTHEIDMVEWRADWYEDVNDTSCVIKIMAELRRFLGELPLLFTFRTQREGGAKNIEGTAYVEINKEVCASG